MAACVVENSQPFVFLFNMAKLVPGSLQLRLEALDANYGLQQVLVQISILLLQGPECRQNMGEAVTEKYLFWESCWLYLSKDLEKNKK